MVCNYLLNEGGNCMVYKYKGDDGTVLFDSALFIRCISEDYQQWGFMYNTLNKSHIHLKCS